MVRPWRDAAKLVDTQGSSPQSSRAVHPNSNEVRLKCQQPCIDEQGAHCESQTLSAEAGMDNLGAVQTVSEHAWM